MAGLLAAPRATRGQGDHLVAYGVVALLLAVLALVYLWRRRRLMRERS